MIKNERKVRMTSSPYGPYELGYTRVTMTITMGSMKVILSQSKKIVIVQIVGCNSPT